MPSPEDRFYRIVEESLCIGCGLCQSAAGSDRITVERTDDGALRPFVHGDLDDTCVDRIYDLCPGTRLSGLPEEAPNIDLVWGGYQRIVKARATDPEIRFKAAAGGVLSAISLFLLESGRVDFILHATMPKADPSFGVRHISRNREDILKGAGSRYGPTATLIDVEEHLSLERPFAFVGTPCDITGLRNLARQDPRVDAYCKAMLTPVCGGFMETPALSRAVAGFGMNFDRLTAVRYRGHGCPGPTRLEQDDGAVIEKTYLDFWGEDDSAWSLPWRCKICADGIGEAADIAAADCWPGGAPTRAQAEDHTLDPGSNAVLVRSQRGEQIWQAALDAGALVEESTHTPRDMDNWQPHQVVKKRAVQSRYDGMKRAGSLVPTTTGLRLSALQAENTSSQNAQETEGTLRRIQAGKAREPGPRSAGRRP